MTRVTGNQENGNKETETSSSYDQLQQQLTTLGYNETFTSESISLIQELLGDFLVTAEKCRLLKSQYQKVEREKWKLQCQTEPLRRTLVSLTKENNQLRVELIHAADTHDKEHVKTNNLIRKYEREISELKFLNLQYKLRAQQLESKFESERKKIEELLNFYEEICIAVGKETGENVLEPVLEYLGLEEPLDPMEDKFDIFVQPDPHVVDSIQLSQKRIEELERSNKELSDKENYLQEQISSLEQRLLSREKEIARFGTLLINKRSGLTSGSPTDASNSKLQQLETQLEYLHDHVIGLEQVYMFRPFGLC
ncbi:14060_t:CDS:2 [Funneliformis caledonium]|uniref:14060_t:CDS:1 n=1 Tax=Funneliformis caledonium TaxID=1117310 RepID=A0A9N8V6Y0_9GLOM|nr:14060_t:CDS:2 [Funneliformis caledonium]